MSEQQDELIAQFIEISGGDENIARFYLSSSNWLLDEALSNFLNNQSEDRPATGSGSQDVQVPSSSSGTNQVNADANGKEFVKTTAAKPKFGTLNDMSKRPTNEEEGQAFYAGGSDRSGQQVLGPPKRKNFREQLTDMFRMAEEHNMHSDTGGPSTSARGGGVWGQGVRLGMTDNDHSVVSPQRGTGSGTEKKPVVVLKLWSQGFSINDGELRLYDDPDNKEFLETVMRGEIPQELLAMGKMVNVDVEDHRHEDFKKKTTVQSFKGSGHQLGSPTPNIIETPDPVATPSNTSDPKIDEDKARETLNCNTSAPSTTLQIRLADGTRLAAQFNLSHTVSDIRHFIQNARPQYANGNFILVTSFPTRELTDESSTIETAGLKNAALMQRLK